MDLSGIKLSIELIPATSWFDNVRSFLRKGEWDLIKTACYTRAGRRCEICGGKGPSHPVECHEIWHYDEVRKVQSLQGLIALCPSCHRVKHLGNTARLGKYHLDNAMRHLRRVNGWNEETADAYVRLMFAQWHERTRHSWKVDPAWLHDNRESYVRDAQGHARQALALRMSAAMSSKRTEHADEYGAFS